MKKSKKDEHQRYVKLDDDMTNSASWTALSPIAVWLYIELRKSYNSQKGGNSHLKLPYSKVAWKFSKGTISAKMKELIDYGFVRIIEPGGLFKRPTIYALSDNWKQKSIEIVDQEGKEAIRLGLVKKPHSKNNLKNLVGKRKWERTKKR